MKLPIHLIVPCAALAAPCLAAQDPVASGAVQFLTSPPSAVYRDALESDVRIVLFRERGSFQLTESVAVDETGTGLVDQSSDLTPGLLPTGTLVESYLFHQDGTTNAALLLEGGATFAKPILGVVVVQSQNNPTLVTTDGQLGWPGTIYPGQPGDNHAAPQDERGLEFDQPDQFTVSGDRLTLTVRFRTTDRMDQVRVITAADVPAAAFCFGDGSVAPCPCSNDVASGAGTGCANSTGVGAHLSYSSGSNSTAVNSLALKMTQLPPHTFGLLFMGQTTTQQVWADGFRCVSPGPPGSPAGTGFLRFPIQNASAQGEIVQSNIVSYMNGSGAPPVIQPGATWHFQGYYRNPAMLCTNANLTNGLTVTFY